MAEQHDWVSQFLRSRVVSRRAALRAAASALTVAGGGILLSGRAFAGHEPMTSGAAVPAFTGRRVSFGGDPTRQMAMAAELTAPPAGQVLVDLGTDLSYGHTSVAEVRYLLSLVPQQDGSIRAAQQWFAHGFATRLDPGCSYHYRFRLPNGTVGPGAVFTTAPAERRPFTFTAFGDHGVDSGKGNGCGPSDDYYSGSDTRRAGAPAAALVARIAERRPAFHLLAGDIAYAGTGGGGPVRNNPTGCPGNGFEDFDPTTWTRYFASIESVAAGTPWMFATGNHDVEALYDDNTRGGTGHGYGGHAARLDLPTNGPGDCPSVYRFRYSNVGFLSLDSNDLAVEATSTAGYSRGAQLAWVRRTLSDLRGDPDIDFIVIFLHHCAYATSSAHASDDGIRSTLAPLCDAFFVDLVIQGHNHVWERTSPIRFGGATVQAPDGSTVRPQLHGTTWITVGSGGRPRTGWQGGETDRCPGVEGSNLVESYLRVPGGGTVRENVDWSQARYADYALLVVDVDPAPPGGESTMTVRTFSDLGLLLDTVTLAHATPLLSLLPPLRRGRDVPPPSPVA